MSSRVLEKVEFLILVSLLLMLGVRFWEWGWGYLGWVFKNCEFLGFFEYFRFLEEF